MVRERTTRVKMSDGGVNKLSRWDSDAKEHLGSNSSLKPPTDSKRRSVRRQPGLSGFKRAGWAALEDKAEEEKQLGAAKKKAKAAAGAAKAEATAAKAEATAAKAGASSARKRQRQLFPAGSRSGARKRPPRAKAPAPQPYSEPAWDEPAYANGEEAEGGEAELVGAVGGGGAAAAGEAGMAAAPPRKRRSRHKKLDEGDWKELKPRHLKGRRKEEMLERQTANAAAAAKRRADHAMGVAPPADRTELMKERQQRLLRPKFRRWCFYEWFYSPVDYGWFRENDFAKMLQACGLGRITTLCRLEWSTVRLMLGRVRRFSAAFISKEREKLHSYREEVRALRRVRQRDPELDGQTELERLSSGSAQMAVGQRVVAFHPKERHLYTGTVLTPDGDHYKVQFDRQKQGVCTVKDFHVMPLLDGSRGIDFTSPRSFGPTEEPPSGGRAEPGREGGDSGRRLLVASAGAPSAVRADSRELQLVAYILRLLDRKSLLMEKLKDTCAEAEGELKSHGMQLHAMGVDAPGLLVDDEEAPRVEVTAAQQRQLGQVPPPPHRRHRRHHHQHHHHRQRHRRCRRRRCSLRSRYSSATSARSRRRRRPS